MPEMLYWWTECVEVVVSCVECTMSAYVLFSKSHYVHLVLCDCGL